MICKLIIFGILPALTLANISVNIKTGKDEDEAKVDVLGCNIGLITDKDINTFDLGDHNLKDSVWKYLKNAGYPGGWPSDAYLKSPTPYDEFYKKHGWYQVQKVLCPINTKILGVTTEPTIVAKQEFINNSTVTATYDAAIEQSVSQTASNSWSKSGEFSFTQEINYKLNFKVAEVGGSTSFGYSSGWGEETSKSISSSVGSKSGVNVELKPGQAVVAQLTANKGTMEVQVEYGIYLYGKVALHYKVGFQGNKFFMLDINDVMGSRENRKMFKSTETLKIGYYSDARIVVKDLSQSDTIYSGSVPIKLDEAEVAASAPLNGFD